MSTPRIILCSGVRPTGIKDGPAVVRLDVSGAHANVNLRISDISNAMATIVPDVLIDLLEIAAYVYSTDQAVSRGGARDTGKLWRRTLRFHVPVRCPDIWSSDEVSDALTDVLSFLSEDEYEFTFTKLRRQGSFQYYLENMVPAYRAEEVLLFSGGLDSLAGAVQAAIVDERRVALVSHRSAAKRVQGVSYLADQIQKRAPRGVRHIPVWATKDEGIGHEYTQRTRSFLYASLATTVARMLRLDGIRFYENGVTSINLPIAEQVVGARATRTTHPKTLAGFARLASLLLDRPFAVESPFLWKTKSDVIRIIKDHGCGDLIPRTVSCSRTVEATKLHTHCGRCSQCLERRFAALAVGLSDEEDPDAMYKVRLLSDPRALGETRTMAESFLRRANALRTIKAGELIATYPEANRSVRHVGLSSDEAAERICELYRRHGEEIHDALAEGHRRCASDLLDGTLPDSCLVALAVHERYREQAEPKGPVFRLNGDQWEIWFQNERGGLKNCIGARYLAMLLANPGQELHVIDMKITEAVLDGRIKPEALGLEDAEESGLSIRRSPSGTAGGATDRIAVKSFRAALLRAEEGAVQAREAKDIDQAIDLERSAKRLRGHLNAVLDLRGKPRPIADDDERARASVTKELQRTVSKLWKRHLPLARHLHSSHFKKGLFCLYRPDPPVFWVTR